MNNQFVLNFIETFPHLVLKTDHNLASYSTFQAGGNAQYMTQIENTNDLILLSQMAHQFDIPLHIFGSLSNTLISDKGLEGLVILNKSSQIEIIDAKDLALHDFKAKYVPARLTQLHPEEFFSVEDLDYDHSIYPPILVKIASGLPLIKAVYKLFSHEICGLEMFAGIPGTIGGALFTNAHGGERFFGELVYSARLLDSKSHLPKTVNHEYFDFNYDFSSLQKNPEVILDVTLVLRKMDIQIPKKIAREWARRKSNQPQKSLGSVFQNLSHDDAKTHNIPTVSVGYLLDKVLGLKGTAVGGAILSQEHANIIKNDGSASAQDYYNLVQKIKQIAYEKIGIKLKEEIHFLGDFT